MSAMSRREFVKKSAAGATAARLLFADVPELRANPLGLPIGCWTYPVRKMIAQDYPGTVKQLAGAGFQRIELCSPVGYANSGFADIAGYKGPDLRRLFGDLGVKGISSYFEIKELLV